MQNVIVAILVGVAVFLLLRKFIRSIKAVEEDTCGCGCSACPEMNTCEENPKPFVNDKK